MSEMSAHQQLPSLAAERRRADYHPSVWGDFFLSDDASQERMDFDDTSKQQIEDLKNEVKRIFEVAASDDNRRELLNLVNHTQRLGIGYHFEKEIDEALKQVHERSIESVDGPSFASDLYTTALMFRLLRQQGYKINSSAFSKFKGPDGNFDESLETDVRGLLSLYEASHLRTHGEDVLEEALAFTLTHLASTNEKLGPALIRDEISRSQRQFNIRKGLTRLDSRKYIKIYEEEASHNKVLLKLAKLDFNLLQTLHQREIGCIVRWWKSLYVKKNFPFTRDRIVECYFWSMLAYELEHGSFRIIFTKVIAMITIIDDIFDVHGTFEELEVFTRAVERWDMEVIDELPDYMQVCYRALLDVYREAEHLLPEEVGSYSIYFGIESMKGMVRAYFAEAKWYHHQYTPTMEEYMQVALVSGGGLFLAATAFVGLKDVVTKDDFEWLFKIPKILRGCQIVIRLVNDMVTHKFEQKVGQVASAVECYMKQYGVTEEKAKHELWKHVNDAWKDINEEALHQTVVSAPLLNMIVDIARMIGVWYEDIDIYTHSSTRMKDGITSLFIDPFPLDM
ncbi:(-)-germacrene D synthase-like isoform X1 [Punica granatum]|nr:(-)-germacrene D synthase-like isoform X1 [Punica granatum]